MGEKGSKYSRDTGLSEQLLTEKLAGIEGISTKKMFGGYGVFHDGKMFGIVDTKGQIYFKIDDDTRSKYEAEGAVQQSRMPYFSIVDSVLQNHDVILERAEHAIKISK